ncbi:exosome nuclease subunit [Dispira parvispora]|uniref:Exosome nuclease subunit n=1 Tax=Dispira parvispora TaxID=1520584 RepID=A0A9W8E4Z8_9FUNG|nr:exosome nuclease subunit [Dispira parvispora]
MTDSSSKSTESGAPPHPLQQFDAFSKNLFTSLVRLTKACNKIPTRDLSFYRTMDGDFSDQLDVATADLLKLGNRVAGCAATEPIRNFQTVEDVTGDYQAITDVTDNLLERVDTTIDAIHHGGRKTTEMEERLKQSRPIVTTVHKSGGAGRLDYKLIHAQNISRPQLSFKDQVDNSPNTPFEWKIRHKDNALISLEESRTWKAPGTSSAPSEDQQVTLPNPYTYEILHSDPSPALFESQDPTPCSPLESTSAQWVSTEAQLDTLVDKLTQVTEVAVDLEHHNLRSFQGFVCLMQISTRGEDFLVDTLVLREHIWKLNRIFTNPRIVKVFHGAESDIKWLQRDFGVYVVGLFDTYHATKVLSYPHHSLAFLLQRFCDFTADKRYQLADWRIRPLPQEMLSYAQSDTHFLLYIFDRLRMELLGCTETTDPYIAQQVKELEAAEDKKVTTFPFMRLTHKLSGETAKKTFVKERYDSKYGEGENGWRRALKRYQGVMNRQQFAVFREIHAWRDRIAREEDESVRYVLPGHMLRILANKMPTEASKLLGCCNPTPPLIRMYAADLAVLIASTRMKNPLVQTESAAEPPMATATHVRFENEPESKGSDAPYDQLTLEELVEQVGGQVEELGADSEALLDSQVAMDHNSGAEILAARSSLLAALGSCGIIPTAQKKSARTRGLPTQSSRKIVEEIESSLLVGNVMIPEDVVTTEDGGWALASSQPQTMVKGTTNNLGEQEQNTEQGDAGEVASPVSTERKLFVVSEVLQKSAGPPSSTAATISDQASAVKDNITLDKAPELLQSTFGKGSEDQVVAPAKSKKSRRSKRKKTESSNSNPSTGANSGVSTPVEGESPAAFAPFDYANARSVADVDPADTKQFQSRKKTKKRAQGDNRSARPYDTLEIKPELNQGVVRSNLAPKSGNRQSVYKSQ